MTDAPRDDTILMRINDWWMEDDVSSHVLHVHGDKTAHAAAKQIQSAFGELAKENTTAPFFTAEELTRRIEVIAGPLGLTGYFGPKKCGPDPVDQVRDVSLFRKAAP